MLEKFAGYATDIRNWERRLKEMDSKKANPAKVKEIQEIIKNLKDLLKEKQEKKEQRKKDKESKSQEVSKEAVVETEASVDKEALAPTCPICAAKFPNHAAYQTHREEVHGHPKEYQPMDLSKKRDIVKTVENRPSVAPHIISEKEEPKAELHKFFVDDKVEPIRNSNGSWGHVMRPEGINNDPLVYVKWIEGPLSQSHQFGGYYPTDLQKKAEGNPPAPDVTITSEIDVMADLKSKYNELLKDLKDEREAHFNQGNSAWVARLDFKIKELEDKIQEKFGNEKTAVSDSPFHCENCHAPMSPLEQSHLENLPNGDQKWTCNKKQAGAQNSEQLTIIDHSIPRPNKTRDEGGRDGDDEFQDLWGGPAGTEVSSSLKKATQINIFNKSWSATPVTKNNKLAYEITDTSGNKVLQIAPVNGQEMNAEHLKWAVERELKANYKKAKLTESIAMLPKGTKVLILAQDKAQKRIKIASLEQNIRAWVPASKLQITALESQKVQHRNHLDPVLGASGVETLLDCVDEGPIWVNSVELLDANRPPSTPESLNEEAPIEEEAAKECPDCQGNFVGAEGETCPTCGRFAVEKAALMTALPTTIPNQRGYLSNPPVEASLKIESHIRHEGDKWIVWNHDYTKRLGEYPTKEKAIHRLKQIEYFKSHKGSQKPFSKKADYIDPDWTTKKVGEFFDEMVAEKFMMDNHLENGFYRKEGNKYVVYTDVPISSMASKKKAEVLTDPYASLTTHITEMKSRMSQVQERLQSAPVTKAAGEEDNSKLNLPELFEDLTMGINLLETKLGGDDIKPELHNGIEDLENLLWTLEENLGIVPELSEHEQEEPEHKEVVEKAKEMEKESQTSTTTTTSPASPATNTTTKPDDTKPSCALCGGLPFTDYASYQNHMEYSHASDTMPTSPSQKNLPTTVKSNKEAESAAHKLNRLRIKIKEFNPLSVEYRNLLKEIDELAHPSYKKADVTEEEIVTNDPNAITPATPTTTPTTTIQNVQPTDDDNLEIPTQAPTSKLPPGQKWQWDSTVGKYVAMTDPSNINKTI